MLSFKILHIPEVTSTNSVLIKRASEGEKEGVVITTDFQTEGRGKQGNKWISPNGENLLFSVLLTPPIKPSEAPLLTQVACRAVAKALKEKYDIHSYFKRPNDVIVDRKKICGILVEASTTTKGKLENVVIGIGLNVNSEEKDLLPEATSMKALTNKKYSRSDILKHILDKLREYLKEIYKDKSKLRQGNEL